MTGKRWKTKVGPNSVVNLALDKTGHNKAGCDKNKKNNPKVFKKHLKTSLVQFYDSHCGRRLERLLWHFIFILIVLLYIFLITNYPKFNIFWLATTEDISLLKTTLNLYFFILSWMLLMVLQIITAIYLGITTDVTNTEGLFFATFFIMIASILVLYVDVIPIYRLVFSWFGS